MMGLYYRPRVGLIDTTPAMEHVWIAAWQAKAPAERLALWDAHTTNLRRLSWANLERTRPELSLAARLHLWLAEQYGTDLAGRVVAHLQQQGRI